MRSPILGQSRQVTPTHAHPDAPQIYPNAIPSPAMSIPHSKTGTLHPRAGL